MADNIVVLVGSRASALAKAQVREVLAPLRRQLPDIDFRHRVILEGGDRDRRTPTLAEVAKTRRSLRSPRPRAAARSPPARRRFRWPARST